MEDPGLMNVDQIYTDFLGRRAGLIQALTVGNAIHLIFFKIICPLFIVFNSML